ncbi:HNH endonuclease [uncultured Ellagibacter sp.]|uniref:HNH endonuclease n=1 Tax=uncultured Ellagibacter sp. TaxID=2137580 RepID=UPI00261A5C8E|nr:HNH endonuclease [uncultured Ellagibacter sp.]
MDPREYIEEQIRKAYGEAPQQAIEAAQTTDEDPDQLFTEGAQCSIVADRYERSRSARQACLQANGTVCAICGFDFAKAYGAEFAGIIQVHHITPISEIGHEYHVDPVHDLIPVCPNCHVALHSKPGGTYTPDELRALLSRAENDKNKDR